MNAPLVRFLRRPEIGWSWLCTMPACQEWRTGYPTEFNCCAAWIQHARHQHAERDPRWPDTTAIVLPRRWERTRLRAGEAAA